MTRSKERVKQLAEVFTPHPLVTDILELLPDDVWEPETTFLEPACGDGRFLMQILACKLAGIHPRWRKADHEHQTLTALASIYAVDIDELNVEESRSVLAEMTCQWLQAHGISPPTAEINGILVNNIRCADWLKERDPWEVAS